MMRLSHAFLVFTLLVAAMVACGKTSPNTKTDAGVSAAASSSVSTSSASVVPVVTWDAKEKADALAAGQAVLEKHECTRCHAIDNVPAAGRPFACTGCHVWLKGLAPGDKTYDSLVEKWGAPVVARYQKNIFHLQKVPNLTNLARRVRSDYIASFLKEPYDQRPVLEESMFRHNLDPAEIKAITRYFVAASDAPDPYSAHYQAPELPPAPDADRLKQGKELFKLRGCANCHTIGNIDFGVTKETLVASRSISLLAPNLRFAKERTRPDAIVEWILSPASILPGTTMPALGGSRSDAELLRDYVYYANPELKPTPAPYVPPPIKILDRVVPFAEMKERVLGKVCVHCHMNDYEKDTGPGNKGGFGYTGVGLQMRTYETLVQGAVGADGKRYSILVAKPGEKEAPILQVMMKRRIEEQRDHVAPFEDYERPHYPSDRPAMPMGLPAMNDDEMSILATWIAQGCVGPAEVTGKPGINDGYLVPDGPLTKNKGCELRRPEKPRPKWAVDQK